MVTWKEPLLARQERMKSSMDFHPKVVLVRFLMLLVPPLILFIILSLTSPEKLSASQNARVNFMLPFFYLVFGLLVWGIKVLTEWIANRVEATYFVNEKGLRIKRAGFVRDLSWRHVANLEIVPHPSLANISVIRIRTRRNRPRLPRAIENSSVFREVFQLLEHSLYENIPFESGQVEPSAVFELYEANRKKKRWR